MQRAGLILSALLFPLSLAYNRTTEAGEAAISDGAVECQPYSYSLVTNSLSLFPPIWHPASILPNDDTARDLWNSISGNIPNISVKGTITGNSPGTFRSYPRSDPDCWWSFNGCVTPKYQGLPQDVYQLPEPRTLGYGFDDGPNCSHNAFYDFLSNNNQRATMFYIGSNVMDWPLEAQRAPADGHEVCAHTWSHHYMTAFTSEDVFAELYYSTSYDFQMQAIELVTGITPTCWRPPYGDVDDRIRAIANGLGLRTIMWGYDSEDWRFGVRGVTAADIDANYQQFINDAVSNRFNTIGPIFLTHELSNFTMLEAIKFYPQLKAAFDRIEPIGVALNWTNLLPTRTPIPSSTSTTKGKITSTSIFNRGDVTSLHHRSSLLVPLLNVLGTLLIF
ncbi:carbohydrate esterase family 4 protein [Amanita rubescens]|nr:carbohydrate esterase family 4 protein [Amanita rubescens]